MVILVVCVNTELIRFVLLYMRLLLVQIDSVAEEVEHRKSTSDMVSSIDL